jgi:hypothetical protein
LVLFDDVELLFDEFFGGVERDATAVLARVGTKRRLFSLEMEWEWFSARWLARLLLFRRRRRL